MDQQTLKTILEKHRKWVMNEDGGERANPADRLYLWDRV